VDAKALRRLHVLVALSMHLEPSVTPERSLVDGVAGALYDLARFLQLDSVRIDCLEPKTFISRLNQRLPRLATA
jgi:uncharacterized protein YcaQ